LAQQHAAQAKEPRRRFLPPYQVQWLVPELGPDRAARVAFMLATAARQNESDRARRADIEMERQIVFLRGTKTDAAPREIPLVGAAIDRMGYALRHAAGASGMMFRPWSNIRVIFMKRVSARRERRSRRR